VPPEAVTVADPLLPPLQETFVVALTEAVRGGANSKAVLLLVTPAAVCVIQLAWLAIAAL
jgi:hypothetical protein